MVFDCAKNVKEDLGRDLERLDEVVLLEDCVRPAHQRLLVRQLRDAEHVDAPLFRVFQNLRKTINEVGWVGRGVVDLSKLSFVLRSVWLHSVLRQRRTAEAGRKVLTNIFLYLSSLFEGLDMASVLYEANFCHCGILDPLVCCKPDTWIT